MKQFTSKEEDNFLVSFFLSSCTKQCLHPLPPILKYFHQRPSTPTYTYPLYLKIQWLIIFFHGF